jgi:hypothetical protein
MKYLYNSTVMLTKLKQLYFVSLRESVQFETFLPGSTYFYLSSKQYLFEFILGY